MLRSCPQIIRVTPTNTTIVAKLVFIVCPSDTKYMQAYAERTIVHSALLSNQSINQD
jgi:hypothetical protein